MSTGATDVVVIGAGMVGAACARALARRGLTVHVVDSGVVGAGATAAGMGHVVVMDDSEEEFALSHYSRKLWEGLSDELPRGAEYRAPGTLWVAADEEEFAAVRSKHAWYGERGIVTEILDPQALAEAEPHLRSGLAGGLLVRGDMVVYAPVAARWMLQHDNIRLSTHTRVRQVKPGEATLESGQALACADIVCATGAFQLSFLPGLPVRPRKGHLMITDRYPDFVRHQLVELGYLKSAHGVSTESVAFNAQPRATGQVLLGSSRQFGVDTPEIDWPVLSKMMRRAFEYMPELQRLSVIRTWTGFRASTADKLPLIGPQGSMERVWLATGHEGLGITTSLGTAELIAGQITGSPTDIPVEPYLPQRPTLGEFS